MKRVLISFRQKARWATIALGLLLLLTIVGWFAVGFMPLPSELFEPVPASFEFVDRHGLPLRRARQEAQDYHSYVPLREIPQSLIHATIAAEDQRFWEHHGMDSRAILRAAWQNLRHRRVVSGASTITQQLIKNVHPRPRTFPAKCLETLQSLRLEREWSKARILEAYLNRIHYGPMHLGCRAAAEFYFGKPPTQLSIAECALLAGLPQAPTRLEPRRHFDRARQRQLWILARMSGRGWLTPTELDGARSESINIQSSAPNFFAPHLVDLLLQLRPAEIPHMNPVRTTVDLELQQSVERFVRHQLASFPGSGKPQAAAVVIENRTGGVLALVGSSDFFEAKAGQVNHAWSRRQPGSALKPFAYALALERGATPASVLADIPCEFPTPTGPFLPQNYDHRYTGPARLRNALACSLNVAAVQAVNQFASPELLWSKLRECGLSTVDRASAHYGLGLVLGNAEVRLLELANAYACLARLGVWQPVQFISRENRSTSPANSARRVFEVAPAFLIADILSDNAARAPTFGLNSALRFDFPVACKTGTSSDYRDNWAFGFTPEFTVGVWVGNTDGSPMHDVSGVTGAGPILHDTIEFLHARWGTSWYDPPPHLTRAAVHPILGKRVPSDDPLAVTELFIDGTEPPFAEPADFDAYHRVRLDPTFSKWLETAPGGWRQRAWVLAANGQSPLHLIFPTPGMEFVLEDTLPSRGAEIELRADPAESVRWSSVTLPIIARQGRTFAHLSEGRHQLTAHEATTGESVNTWVQVSDQ